MTKEQLKIRKISAINKIMTEGNEVHKLQWAMEREKTSGAMYRGSMVAEYCGIVFHFKLFYQHNSSECMDKDRILSNLDLAGVEIGNKYYDTHWHVRHIDGMAYLHKDGWYGISEQKRKLSKAVDQCKTAKELEKIGFIRVEGLDYL